MTVSGTHKKRLRRKDGGFTMIELITVVMIIGILAVIIIPNYVKFANRAKEALLKENMHVLQSGLEMYSIDNLGVYPTAAEEGTLEDLMPGQSFPTNPFTKAKTDIVWDAPPAAPGEVGIISLPGGGFEIQGRGRDRVLDLKIRSGN